MVIIPPVNKVLGYIGIPLSACLLVQSYPFHIFLIEEHYNLLLHIKITKDPRCVMILKRGHVQLQGHYEKIHASCQDHIYPSILLLKYSSKSKVFTFLLSILSLLKWIEFCSRKDYYPKETVNLTVN